MKQSKYNNYYQGKILNFNSTRRIYIFIYIKKNLNIFTKCVNNNVLVNLCGVTVFSSNHINIQVAYVRIVHGDIFIFFIANQMILRNKNDFCYKIFLESFLHIPLYTYSLMISIILHTLIRYIKSYVDYKTTLLTVLIEKLFEVLTFESPFPRTMNFFFRNQDNHS